MVIVRGIRLNPSPTEHGSSSNLSLRMVEGKQASAVFKTVIHSGALLFDRLCVVWFVIVQVDTLSDDSKCGVESNFYSIESSNTLRTTDYAVTGTLSPHLRRRQYTAHALVRFCHATDSHGRHRGLKATKQTKNHRWVSPSILTKGRLLHGYPLPLVSTWNFNMLRVPSRACTAGTNGRNMLSNPPGAWNSTRTCAHTLAPDTSVVVPRGYDCSLPLLELSTTWHGRRQTPRAKLKHFHETRW